MPNPRAIPPNNHLPPPKLQSDKLQVQPQIGFTFGLFCTN